MHKSLSEKVMRNLFYFLCGIVFYINNGLLNRPFPSSFNLNLITKARLSAKFLLWKLVFIHMQKKVNFHMKSFTLSPAS